jgi:large subunit ribosomal protein L6
MSRIGRSPVIFDKSVQVTITPDNEVVVKGAKSSEKVRMRKEIKAQINGQELVLTRANDLKPTRALHGLYRALIQNAVTGVTKGFSKSLELVGVGYRAGLKGKQLEMTLGFSHPIVFDIPQGIEIKVDKQTLVTVTGSNRALVGEVAAKLRGFKPPEPYLGKGVKYQNEVIRKKAGKAAGK